MRRPVHNKITTIIGHKGHGKTTLTEMIMIRYNKPTIIIDPRFQYQTSSNRRLAFTSVSAFKKWITKRENYRLFIDYKLEIVVNAFIDTFQEAAEIIYKMKKIVFVVDEIDMFFDTRATNKNKMYDFVHYGRHNEIDIITTSRRPANISRNLTSQTDIFYFSKLREPMDKKYIKDSVGMEFVSTVENLERYSFLKIDDDHNQEIIKTTIQEVELLQT